MTAIHALNPTRGTPTPDHAAQYREARKYQAQERYVFSWWRCALDGLERAVDAARAVSPEDLQVPALARAYALLTERFAAGESIDPDDPVLRSHLVDALGVERLVELRMCMEHPVTVDLAVLARPVLHMARIRRTIRDARALAADLEEAYAEAEPEALGPVVAHAREGAATLVEVATRAPENGRPQTREDVARALVEATQAGGISGYGWPWPLLGRRLGSPILSGRIHGFTALPGCGKSVFGANLFAHLTRRGVPVLPVVTEMATQWVARAVAAEAGVEQAIAENGLWDPSDREVMRALRQLWPTLGDADVRQQLEKRRARYTEIAREYRRRPYAPICVPGLTAEGMMGRVRVLRRQFPGLPVVVILDHAHNLSFPDAQAERHIGQALHALKEFVESDPDGVSLIAFFQPRKVGRESARHAKFNMVPASEAGGQVERHLDTHASLFRQWVYTEPNGSTAWGDPQCAVREDRSPMRVVKKEEWGEAGTKVDNEHVYFYADKTRIESPGVGGLFYLDIAGPFGSITEFDPYHLDEGR